MKFFPFHNSMSVDVAGVLVLFMQHFQDICSTADFLVFWLLRSFCSSSATSPMQQLWGGCVDWDRSPHNLLISASCSVVVFWAALHCGKALVMRTSSHTYTGKVSHTGKLNSFIISQNGCDRRGQLRHQVKGDQRKSKLPVFLNKNTGASATVSQTLT